MSIRSRQQRTLVCQPQRALVCTKIQSKANQSSPIRSKSTHQEKENLIPLPTDSPTLETHSQTQETRIRRPKDTRASHSLTPNRIECAIGRISILVNNTCWPLNDKQKE